MSLIDKNWERLFDKYDIKKKVSESGLFYITADQIREFKEPRLMTKFDTKESLPSVFGNRMGILPVTRGKYVIGEFDLYEEFPEERTDIIRVPAEQLSARFETIDLGDIRSEAAAINVMGITGILKDFLGEEYLCQTVSGRMGSGDFSFQVSGRNSDLRNIQVNNSQVEIDGGFEGGGAFAIIEGKNVVHSNFLVRQLYYPFRLWKNKNVKKPIKPVFMVYSNNIFRLMEYEFTDLNCYNSIRLVRQKNYSMEDTRITKEELYGVWNRTKVRPEPDVTFIQADSFDKVISLVENLEGNPLTTSEIAELFGFRERQSDYYFNACRYLGLAVKASDEEGTKKVYITERGAALLKLDYKSRQLRYVQLILEHAIFHELFEIVLRTGIIPEKSTIAARMRYLGVCGESLVERRSSSVSGWLKWMSCLLGQTS